MLGRARERLAPLISRLPGRRRRSGPEQAGEGTRAEPGAPAGEIPGDGSFPGFAPPPTLQERVRGALASLADGARRNPRVLAVSAGALLAAALSVAAVAAAFRPPKPVAPPRISGAAALEILRSLPVPRIDPLAEETPLDRPRKDRYTEVDVARLWIDLGTLPTEELRERNRGELRNILSAMEKP